ncbi:hypothetical protein HRbin22_00216 [Candidatus Thermoflexus japonica]|uniref:Uncharacterized protein n=1 Tax=Candidatus Thermoflexus japonica TaxID=2035417 RepID=A0A2H5Y3H1_9CHLR|nr:hypothetical protein HRbin22_00216 [Candidatus Thermoflexus japonica]
MVQRRHIFDEGFDRFPEPSAFLELPGNPAQVLLSLHVSKEHRRGRINGLPAGDQNAAFGGKERSGEADHGQRANMAEQPFPDPPIGQIGKKAFGQHNGQHSPLSQGPHAEL